MYYFWQKYGTLFLSVIFAFYSTIQADEVALREYLKNCGYPIDLLQPVKTNGGTECRYFILRDPKTPCFIKSGEKVAVEVENFLFLSKNGFNSMPTLCHGSSAKETILITELLPQPNYGFEMVNAFRYGELNVDEFLQFQAQTFSKLNELYKIPLPKNNSANTSSILFVQRVQERLQDLVIDQDMICINRKYLDTKQDIYLKTILNKPIFYERKEQTIQIPSIIKIVNDFLKNIVQIPSIPKKYILHGDFEPINVVKNQKGEICFVDLSDLKFGEDPTWDLGNG